MSSYFDQLERSITDAANKGAHMPWYVRIRRVSRARGLMVALAALVVAAPAVGATTNWFGFGKPEYFPKNTGIGHVVPRTSELLALRVTDPQGGPSWGMRIVRTTQGDACIQLGRVENGQLGALGIDYAWNNDHQFHRFPNTSIGESCGTTDAVGHAFVNVTDIGAVANANPVVYHARGPQTESCQLVFMNNTRVQPPLVPKQYSKQPPLCPAGSERIIFMGLLGPDARSITYRAPSGSLRTVQTTGDDGAYLLVFALTQTTCNLYTNEADGDDGCGGTKFSSTTPTAYGAITAVIYRSGRVCNLDPAPKLAAAYQTMEDRILLAYEPRLDRAIGFKARVRIASALDKDRHAASNRFRRAHHLTVSGLQEIVNPQCPVVGYVTPKEKRLTPAELATSITLSPIKFWTRPAIHQPGLNSGPVKLARVIISFAAPQPVTNSDSWYEDEITPPASCGRGSSFGGVGPPGDVPAGKELHAYADERACKGVYHGVIGYMQNGGPQGGNEGPPLGIPGHDGSVIVGHFTFTIL